MAAYQLTNPEVEFEPLSTADGAKQKTSYQVSDDSVTTRRVLRVQRLSQLDNAPSVPNLNGAALIVGSGPVADKFARRISELGKPVYRIEETDDPQQVVQRFEEIWQTEPVPHLFLTGPKELNAETSFDSSSWQRRRQRGVMTPFWLCQSWLKHVIDNGMTEESSLVATISLGGQFGLTGDVVAAESGGVAALLKAMIIENWTNDIRTLPIKVIDTPRQRARFIGLRCSDA